MNSCCIRVTLATALVVLVPAVPRASVSNDQVQSQHIREADRTSGQNTNAGSGVKTGHIQDGAVTAPKLGIACPDGFYLQYTMFGGWTCSVGTPGPVGPQGPAGVAPKYANVIVVAKSGGDFIDPRDAVNSITDASALNPYLVKVMPGVYDIGAASITVPAHVDIEGSGADITTIKGSSSSGSFTLLGYYAGPAQLRSISIEATTIPRCDGGDYTATAVNVWGAGAPTIVDARIVAFGGTTNNALLAHDGGTAALRNSIVDAHSAGCGGQTFSLTAFSGANVNVVGGQIKCQGGFMWSAALGVGYGSSATLRAVDVDSDAVGLRIYDAASTVKVFDSRVQAQTALDKQTSEATIKLANSQIVGQGLTPEIWKLFSCFDANFDPL